MRNRREDILPLMSKFLGQKYKQLSEPDKKLLYKYTWPGNVRELESAAIHYNTLSKLPMYILDTLDTSFDISKSSHSLQNLNIEIEILKIVMENTQLFHGIGRMQLNTYLKSMQVNIGDASLRNVLKELQEKGFIKIGKGRSGTKITESGIKKIKESQKQATG